MLSTFFKYYNIYNIGLSEIINANQITILKQLIYNELFFKYLDFKYVIWKFFL